MPPRPPAPSALDGFRRLERTRAAARDAARGASVEQVQPMEHVGVRRTRRVAGAMRIVGMLAVIAIIAGTSIGLATSDPRSQGSERTASSTASTSADTSTGDVLGPPAPTRVATKAAAAKEAAPKEATPPAAAPRAAAPTRVAAKATAPKVAEATMVPDPAPVRQPAAALPFTGADVDVLRVLLAGGVFALLGMLVQIAGTPLPARRRARR